MVVKKSRNKQANKHQHTRTHTDTNDITMWTAFYPPKPINDDTLI